jgi:hypothetical protein
MAQPTTTTTTPLNTKRSWTRDGFLISTDASLIPIAALTQAFESEQLYWAKGLPEDVMREMLSNSLCFGLYSPTPAPPAARETATTTTIGTNPDALDGSTAVNGTDSAADTLHEIAEHVHGHAQPGGEQVPQSSSSSISSPPFSSSSSATNLIGFARCITDQVTLLYLTDVYIAQEWQGQGLGKWLVGCVQEVVADMPCLRRTLLITGTGQVGKRFYGGVMGMEELSDGIVCLSARGPGSVF